MSTAAFEQHFTVQQLSDLWGISTRTIRRWFEDEPGVLKRSMPTLLGLRTHKPHVTLRIPASVAERLHQQWSGTAPSLKVQRTRRGI